MQFLDGAGAAAMALGALGVGAGVLGGIVGAAVLGWGCLVTFTIGSLNVGGKEMHSINLEYKWFFL